MTSLGKPPTGWRAGQGLPWQWLRKDQAPITLPNGAQLSLNKYDEEGAIFSLQQGQYYGQQGGYVQGGYGYGQQGGYQQEGGYGQ